MCVSAGYYSFMGQQMGGQIVASGLDGAFNRGYVAEQTNVRIGCCLRVDVC